MEPEEKTNIVRAESANNVFDACGDPPSSVALKRPMSFGQVGSTTSFESQDFGTLGNTHFHYLFESFCILSTGKDDPPEAMHVLTAGKFLQVFTDLGFRMSDPQLDGIVEKLKTVMSSTTTKSKFSSSTMIDSSFVLTFEQFKTIIADQMGWIDQIANHDLVIKDFPDFCSKVELVYKECQLDTSGNVATYIPQLAKMNPNYWGVSICTVDGQRMCLGDTNVPFCLQSCSKALTYAIALNDLGSDVVHQYIGQEPSGLHFNAIALDPHNKPHNPMINSGAIVTASLIKPGHTIGEKFDHILQQFTSYAGKQHVGFNNSVFLSEKETADRNYAIAYHMREMHCFPEGTNLMDTVDLYFQLCSTEVTCDVGAVMAATLANGGICPTTNERLGHPHNVKNVLSLMLSCGMYDYSGQFAFHIGLPAKSGVSGAIMLVVPNVAGICIFSPRLDALGNSARGLSFCKAFVDMFNLHHFSVPRTLGNRPNSPRSISYQPSSFRNRAGSFSNKRKCARNNSELPMFLRILWAIYAASVGDLKQLFAIAQQDIDLNAQDYDQRTALHMACDEGHASIVQFLLSRQVKTDIEDRWGHTPMYYAVMKGHSTCAELVENHVPVPSPSTSLQPSLPGIPPAIAEADSTPSPEKAPVGDH